MKKNRMRIKSCLSFLFKGFSCQQQFWDLKKYLFLIALCALCYFNVLDANGNPASLSISTEKLMYLASEPVQISSQYEHTGDALILGGELKLQVKATAASKMWETWSDQVDFQVLTKWGIDTFNTPGKVTLLPISDDFNAGFLNTDRWIPYSQGAEKPEVVDGALRIYLPYDKLGHVPSSLVKFNGMFTGDFDVYTDYKITEPWYDGDNHPATLSVSVDNFNVYVNVWGSTPTYGSYFTNSPLESRPGAAMEGKLRVSRQGSTYRTYYWDENSWVLFKEYLNRPAGPAMFFLRTFGDHGNQESFYDNFTSQGKTYCSSGTFMLLCYRDDTGSWGDLSFLAEQPENTSVKFRTRTAGYYQNLSDGPWSGYITESGSAITSAPGKWIEIEVSLATTDPSVTPVLDSVTVSRGTDIGDVIWETVSSIDIYPGASFSLDFEFIPKSIDGNFQIGGKFQIEGVLSDAQGQILAAAFEDLYLFQGTEGLKIDTDDAPDSVSVFDGLTYSLLVVNAGEDIATDVVLTDQLPSSTLFVSAESTQGSCVEEDGIVTCSIGDLAPFSAARVNIKTVPIFVGSIQNTATLSATSSDPDTSDNEKIFTTIVNPLDGDYDISDSPFDLAVTQVSPVYSGNIDGSRLVFNGIGFDTSTSIAIIDADGVQHDPVSVDVESLMTLSATFDFSQIPPGRYDIKVYNTDHTQVIERGFEIIEAERPELETHLILPGSFGRHAVTTIYVEYKNKGNVPMPAPLLVLQSADPDGSDRPILTFDPANVIRNLRTSTMPSGAFHSARFLADGDDMDSPGFLMPGESGRMPIYYTGLLRPWDFSDREVEFKLKIITTAEEEPYDWDAAKEDYQPDHIPSEAWDIIFDTVAMDTGPTWGDFVAMLSENASFLHYHTGESVRDWQELFRFELLQAMGHGPLPVLDSRTDISVSAPGLPLAFHRAFSSSIAARHTDGPLGKGWSHSWQVDIFEEEEGDVILTQSGNRIRFEPSERGGYFSPPGIHLQLTQSEGAFVLTSHSGTVVYFREDGKLDYMEDLNGNQITADYADDQLSVLTHSCGSFLAFEYDGFGHISRISDQTGGRDVQYNYNGGQLSEVLDTSGRITIYDYFDQGAAAFAIETITDPAGLRQNFTYDANGRLDTVSYNDNAPVSLEYYIGRVSLTNEADNSVQKIYYDTRGQIIKSISPLLQVSTNEFDSVGNRVKTIGPDGHSIEFDYDKDGNPIEIIDPLGQSIRMDYGLFNRMTGITDPTDNEISYGYDSIGNLVSQVFPDGTSTSYVHDDTGSLIQQVDRNGKIIQYSRDNNGRVVSIQLNDGTGRAYEYDAQDRLVSVTDSAGTIFLEYTPADFLRRITYPEGRFVEYTYDSAGRKASMTDHSGHRLDYQYNPDGLLETIVENQTLTIAAYSYDEMLRLIQKTSGNGVCTIYEYDLAGRLERTTSYTGDGILLSDYVYAYDQMNRRVSMETIYGVWVYTYDTTGQLTKAVFAASDPDVEDREIVYTYDSVGNRVTESLNGQTTHYTADPMKQYVQAGSMTFEYDDTGNLVSKTNGTDTWIYTYNDENRLISNTGPDGSFEYRYNGLGFLSEVTENGTTTHFLTDPSGLGNIVSEYDDAGSLAARYNYGMGLISKNDNYYTFDGSGNVSEMTGPDSTVLNTYGYDPFGHAIINDESVENSFTFAGQFGVKQAGNDLLYMRNRFYSPSTGRFITEDPIGFAGGDISFYRYVLNDPVNLVDPDGLIGKFLFEQFISRSVTSISNAYLDIEPPGRRIISVGLGGVVGGAVTGAVFGTPVVGLGAVPTAIIGGVAGLSSGLIIQTTIEAAGLGQVFEDFTKEMQNNFFESFEGWTDSNPCE